MSNSVDIAVNIATAAAKGNVEELNDLLNDLKKKGDDVSKGQEKANDLFARAFGGGEFAERLKKVGEGFKIAADNSESAGTRIKAFAGAAGLAAQAALALWNRIGQTVARFVELAATSGGTITQFKRFSDSNEELATSLYRAGTGLKDLSEDLLLAGTYLAQDVAHMFGFTGAFRDLADAINNADDMLRGYIHDHGGRTAAEREATAESHRAAAATQTYAEALRTTSQALTQFKTDQLSTSFAVREGEEAVDGLVRRYNAFRSAIIQNRAEQSQNIQIMRQLRTELHATASDLSRAGLGGGGSGGPSLASLQDAENVREKRSQAERQQQLLNEHFGGVLREAQANAAILDQAHDSGERLRRAAEEAAQATAQALSDIVAREHDAASYQVQFARAFAANADLVGTSAQHMAGIGSRAFQTLTNSFKAHLGALIEGRETIGEALRGITHEVLLQIAEESAVQAIFETAKGFAALASYQYPQATGHFTSAAMYAGLAVGSGLGAFATNPSQASANTSTGGTQPRERASVGGGSGGSGEGGNVTINYVVNGSVYHGEQAQDEVVHLANLARQRNAWPLAMQGMR
jgi:hypothetical protein